MAACEILVVELNSVVRDTGGLCDGETIYWNWVRLMSMRSGQPGINGIEYAQLSLTLQSLAEQSAIAAVLTDMDAELVLVEDRLAKTRALKQGMMQQLLIGKTRLL